MVGSTNKQGLRKRVGKEKIRRKLYGNLIQVLKARIHTHPQRAPSYIGICDVHSKRLARAFVHDFRKFNRDPHRKLMIGVMTHPIVLNPNLPVPEIVRKAITNSFPKAKNLADGFINDPQVMNTIHYADLYGPKGPRKAEEAQNVRGNLESCVKHGGPNLHAIQLDVNWPKPSEIKMFRTRHPNIKLVLQVGKHSLKDCNNNPQEVVNRLRRYGNSIDHVLLDLSMGQGRAMTSAPLLPLLRSIRTELPHLGLAVAGGLGPERSRELEQIAREFPEISLDAQGRLKPDSTYKDSLGHLSPLDSANVEKSRKYFKNNLTILDRP